MTDTEKTPYHWGDFFDLRSYYWQTRQWHFAKQGLPAVIVGCVILLPVLLSGIGADSTQRYRVAFNRAVRDQDYETAYLFRQKLESISDQQLSDNEFRFNCAIADVGRGQFAPGMAIMKELAPADSFGYGPAHLWLAKKQIGDDPSNVERTEAETVHHLQGALRGDSKNHSIHLALGHHYFHNGNRPKAIEHLTIAAESQPSLHFILANLHESGGDQDQAEENYELAASSLDEVLAKEPDNLEARINLAVCHNKLGDFTQAVRSLITGLENANEETRAKVVPVLSSFYLAESDRLRRDADPQDPDYVKSLLLLAKALEFSPNNEEAINRIAELASGEGDTGRQALQTLKKLIASGNITPLAHVILATSSLQEGDYEKAKFHFGRAYRLDPKMPVLLNNVAWMLAHQPQPDLEKSLRIINEAIERLPKDDQLYPAFLDTRGHIYLKMKRHSEALADLEYALKSLPPERDRHVALRECYRELGDEDLAAEHERIAESIR